MSDPSPSSSERSGQHIHRPRSQAEMNWDEEQNLQVPHIQRQLITGNRAPTDGSTDRSTGQITNRTRRATHARSSQYYSLGKMMDVTACRCGKDKTSVKKRSYGDRQLNVNVLKRLMAVIENRWGPRLTRSSGKSGMTQLRSLTIRGWLRFDGNEIAS